MWDDVKQLNAISTVLTLVAIVGLAWGGLTWLMWRPTFAFHEVTVRGGMERTSPAQLEAAIRSELIGTFFTMDLDRARIALARVAWVRAIALRRQWPGKLEVTLAEHTPLARWSDGGLVDVEGELFAARFDGELPRFEGPAERSAEMAARYREWKEFLAPLALEVEAIRLSPRGGWHVDAKGDGGSLAIELGREDPTARLERFATAYPRTLAALASVGTHVDHVDLRYRNGFAARVPGFKERAAPKRG
jgi:cell division protein FtsQ